MPKIFISYRRQDSEAYAGRIKDRLEWYFGDENVFFDEEIPPGVDWRAYLDEQISAADIMLAVIGKQWVDMTDSTGKRRLHKSNDMVRYEINRAMEFNKRLIPVVLEGVTMPSPDDLPPDMHPLTDIQCVEIRFRGGKFKRDVDELIRTIEPIVCIQCRETVPPDARYCPQCRAEVRSSRSVPTATPSGSRQNKAEEATSVESLGLEMVDIPAGTFIAGCSQQVAQELVSQLALLDPQDTIKWLTSNAHQTRSLPAYRISRYPVTGEQYDAFVQNTGHRAPPHWNGSRCPPGILHRPVTEVEHGDAAAFCKWIGASLPTADQWEKAARGTDGRIYPWGNEFEESRCNCAEAGARGLVDVHKFATGDSPFGLRQAAGNVWEWVTDEANGGLGLRGGNYEASCSIYGATFTSVKAEADLRRIDVGFRVVDSEFSASSAPAPAAAPKRKTQGGSSVRRDVMNAIETDLITIPPGSYLKGMSIQQLTPVANQIGLNHSQLQQLAGESPHQVQVPEFSIARCCVTNEQYLAFIRTQGGSAPASWESTVISGGREPDAVWLRHPVSGISYDDAKRFCDWLGLRMPSVNEWEKAARGHDDRLFPWGSSFDQNLCNGAESGRGTTVAVDEFPAGASPYGLLNAVGNVFEWLSDEQNGFFALRGGSYQVSCILHGLIGYTMLARRAHIEPSFGLRVAR